jgi:signal transduction histidine kinase
MSLARPAIFKRFAASDIRSAIRRRWRLRTVPGRLTFWYVGTLAVSLGAFATFVLIVRAGSLRSELDADLASRLASLTADIGPIIDRPGLDDFLRAQPGMSSTALLIRGPDGTMFFRSRGVPALEPEWERAAAIGAANQLPFQTVRDANGRDQRLANRSIVSATGSRFTLQLLAPTAGIDRGIRELAGVQAIGILLILAVARYGSAFTARRALAPIDEIIRRGRDIHGHELGKRLEVEADTIEIERLVMSLNQMLERLEEPVHTARRFAANVSHELQTPITAMRFALEAAQRTDRPAEHYREIAGDLLSELDRLSTLIRDLRLLAVAGAGQLVARQELFDIGEVVQQCCEIGRAIAEDKAIRIEERTESGLMVRGSALHLRRAILNLTDNAVRYSPPDSAVVVDLRFEDGMAVVDVSDRGCGISEDDLSKIFEPFFRADRARARDTGGSGLGLAIADQVARAHGGRISVTSEPNKGSMFRLHVPAERLPSA